MVFFKKYSWIFTVLAVSPVFSADLTLKSLIDMGLKHNLELEASRQEAIVAAQDTISADILPNPTLSLEALHNISEPEKPKAGIRLSQEFRPGMRSRQFELAKANWTAKLARQKAREWDLTANIRSAYFAWQILNRKLATQKEVRERWEGLARLASVKVAEGRVSQVEAGQAQLNAAMAQQKELEFQSELAAAENRLQLLTGISGISDSIQPENMDSLPEVPSKDSLNAWNKTANPDLQAFDLETQALDRQVDLENNLRRQAFSLTLGVDRESDGNNLIGGGIEFPIPLFNGNQGGIARSKASLHEAVLQRQAAEKKIAAEIEECQARLVNLSNRYRNYREHIRTLSQGQLSLSEKGFKQGLLGIFDLSLVQQEALAQEMEAYDVVEQFYQQWNRLGRLVGGKIW